MDRWTDEQEIDSLREKLRVSELQNEELQAQLEQSKKLASEWADKANERWHRQKDAELQNQELKKLLVTIKEQGLYHQCAMEGYIEKYGCEDCKTNTEAKIDAALTDKPKEEECADKFCSGSCDKAHTQTEKR